VTAKMLLAARRRRKRQRVAGGALTYLLIARSHGTSVP
jgi:hypothetical protein